MHTPEMTHLAVQFFGTFARFEHALKATPPFRDGDENGVEPNWDRFANVLDAAALFNELRADDRVGYLINNPPKKRVLIDGILEWKEMPKPANMRELALSVRRVRNNLFHGDKAYPNLTRNARLFEASLVVLNAMMVADAGVRSAYETDQEIS